MKPAHLQKELMQLMQALKPIKIDGDDAETAKLIALTVAEVLNITMAKIKCRTRKREYVEARFIMVYLIKKYTSLKLKPIAEMIGNRDYSTVIYCNDTAEDLRLTNPSFRNKLNQVETRLDL